MTTISVSFNSYACWTCDYNIRDFKMFTYVGHVTTISVTPNYLRTVCWTCDYNIRDFKYLRMLDLWLQYSWLLHILYVGHVTTISVTPNYLRMLDLWLNIRDIQIFTYLEPMNTISVTLNSNVCSTHDKKSVTSTHVGPLTKIFVTSTYFVCWTCDYNIRDT